MPTTSTVSTVPPGVQPVLQFGALQAHASPIHESQRQAQDLEASAVTAAASGRSLVFRAGSWTCSAPATAEHCLRTPSRGPSQAISESKLMAVSFSASEKLLAPPSSQDSSWTYNCSAACLRTYTHRHVNSVGKGYVPAQMLMQLYNAACSNASKHSLQDMVH